jgi:hypothetical protein
MVRGVKVLKEANLKSAELWVMNGSGFKIKENPLLFCILIFAF